MLNVFAWMEAIYIATFNFYTGLWTEDSDGKDE